MKLRLLEIVKDDSYFRGHVIKKGQFIGADWDGNPIIATTFITEKNTVAIHTLDWRNYSWSTKYYPIDSPIFPIDFIQRLWVKNINMSGGYK